MKKDSPSVEIDKGNRAGLIGQRCDFYIYLEIDNRSYWSNWIKGRKAADLWDECMTLKGTVLFDKCKSIYNEVGPIRFS